MNVVNLTGKEVSLTSENGNVIASILPHQAEITIGGLQLSSVNESCKRATTDEVCKQLIKRLEESLNKLKTQGCGCHADYYSGAESGLLHAIDIVTMFMDE